MNLGVRLMRMFFPRTERRRMEFRNIVCELEAQAEDWMRVMQNGNGKEISGITMSGQGNAKPDLDKFRHPKKANGERK